MSEDLRTAWGSESTEATFDVDGELHSVYRADKQKSVYCAQQRFNQYSRLSVPKYAELVEALSHEEELDAEAVGNRSFERVLCATTFLALAMDLEERQ